MNKRLYIYPKKISCIFSLMLLIALLTGCVHDNNNDDCPTGTGCHLYFRYDYNMKFADAFANEVDRIDVYIFTQEGEFIRKQSEQGEVLKNRGYFMTLDLDPGTYHLVVWGGLDGTSFRTVQDVTARSTEIQELQVVLNEEDISDDDLHPLWHGEEATCMVPEEGYQEDTIYLVKDTKRIRMVLQQINGLSITDDDFHFEITDDNSLLNYDNDIIPNGVTRYLPYAQGFETVGDIDPVNMVYYEAHTSRLMDDSEARLRVTRTSDGEVIIDIPLIEYLLLTEMEGHKETMSSQEYLDRQDEYSLVFFLDENLTWIQVQIIVNGWTIRYNSSQFR